MAYQITILLAIYFLRYQSFKLQSAKKMWKGYYIPIVKFASELLRLFTWFLAIAEALSPVFSVAVSGLGLSATSSEVETALCSSFIRQMSPSQAMNNRNVPSVRRHPPGLFSSLLASVPCHGLAPAVCLRSTFFCAWHADALSLSGSACLCLSFFS